MQKTLFTDLESVKNAIHQSFLTLLYSILAERKYNWIIYSNTKNNELWVEVKRIMDLTQQIVEVLNPNVVQALVVKNNEIKVIMKIK